MRKLIFLSVLSYLILLTACYKYDDDLTPSERALVGTWKYDKVKYHKGIFNNPDITHEYSNEGLTFNPDKSFAYNDNGDIIEGKWRLEENSTVSTDADGNCSTSYQSTLIIMLIESGKINESLWENVYVTKKLLSAQEQAGQSNECYYYELRKE